MSLATFTEQVDEDLTSVPGGRPAPDGSATSLTFLLDSHLDGTRQKHNAENSLLEEEGSMSARSNDRRRGSANGKGSESASPVEAEESMMASSASVMEDHLKKYPLMYNHNSVPNDYLLREAFNMLKNKFNGAKLTPFANWSRGPKTEWDTVLVANSDSPIQFVGGMLLAESAQYLFEETPFLEKRSKDMRCRFGGYEGDDSANLLEPSKTPTDTPEQQPVKPPDSSRRNSRVGATPNPQEGFKYESQRRKVYFQVHEFEGIGEENNDWNVMTMQLIGKYGPTGKVIYRATKTKQAILRMKNVQVGLVSPAKGRRGGEYVHDDGTTSRMPIQGEEYLKKDHPALFAWCLLHDPVEMGAAITVLKNVFMYFKFSYTVLRTVKRLMTSIRMMQRCTRQFLAKKRLSLRIMLRQWHELEETFRLRLESHESLPGDNVDVAVNRRLLLSYTTDDAVKRRIIEDEWRKARSNYYAGCIRLGNGQVIAERKFSYHMDVSKLFTISQDRLMQRLAHGKESIFTHESIQKLMKLPKNKLISSNRNQPHKPKGKPSLSLKRSQMVILDEDDDISMNGTSSRGQTHESSRRMSYHPPAPPPRVVGRKHQHGEDQAEARRDFMKHNAPTLTAGQVRKRAMQAMREHQERQHIREELRR